MVDVIVVWLVVLWFRVKVLLLIVMVVVRVMKGCWGWFMVYFLVEWV